MSRPRLAVLAAVLLASCAGPTLVMARPSPAATVNGVEHGARFGRPQSADRVNRAPAVAAGVHGRPHSSRVVSRMVTRRPGGVSGFSRDSRREFTLARPKPYPTGPSASTSQSSSMPPGRVMQVTTAHPET